MFHASVLPLQHQPKHIFKMHVNGRSNVGKGWMACQKMPERLWEKKKLCAYRSTVLHLCTTCHCYCTEINMLVKPAGQRSVPPAKIKENKANQSTAFSWACVAFRSPTGSHPISCEGFSKSQSVYVYSLVAKKEQPIVRCISFTLKNDLL